MRIALFAGRTGLVAMTVMSASLASAQNFPGRPVRIVVAEPGGGLDILARVLAPGLTASLGQQLIVDNRPSGVITGEIVSRATPDGHTLLLNGSSHWTLPFMRNDVPYDPVRDFAPVTLATNLPNILVVHPSLQANSVAQLIALAKSRPGELNYGSSSAGTPTHIAAELFKAMSGVNIVRIPYKGAGPALTAVVGNQVQMMFASASSVAPHIKSQRLRALAVTSAEPSALAPGLPTIAASGLPGYEAGSVYGIFAPAKTPAAIVNRLNQDIVRILQSPEVRDKLFSSGVEVVGSTPAKFAAFIATDMKNMAKLIKDAGIKAD